MKSRCTRCSLLLAVCLVSVCGSLPAQEKSVRPGINDTFRDPDPKQFTERFEIESREVFAKREEILKAIQLKPTDVVADIGAGTGLFTRLFAAQLGPEGRVIAVDIARRFLDHIEVTCRERNLRNVETLLCTDDSTQLPPNSVDVAFICDTYHHFEFPLKTMTSLRKALKPGGRVIVVDFRRVEGESTEWTMNHVRAGQEVFEAEIAQAGFRRVQEVQELLKENYMLIFSTAEDQKQSEQKQQQQQQQQGAAEPAAEPATGRGAGPGAGRGRGMGMGRGAGMGRGLGMGRGPDAAMSTDMEVFHYLLERHADIRRKVQVIEHGVETLTESDSPEVAGKIQEHVAAMQVRMQKGQGLRFWDPLFAAIFEQYQAIEMQVENTEHGVRVIETSRTPAVALLIKAHAAVVTRFVERGFEEAHESHPVPAFETADAAVPALQFPVIAGYGGVAAIEGAVDPPRAGTKLVLDVTADMKQPEEINNGLERAARFLNLAGLSGLKTSDLRLTVVLHGEATRCVLTDAAWKQRWQADSNPHLPLIRTAQGRQRTADSGL
ncbi:MAG: methyltransferase domain-containing protein, partial [Planctomycetaceae bacterium]